MIDKIGEPRRVIRSDNTVPLTCSADPSNNACIKIKKWIFKCADLPFIYEYYINYVFKKKGKI